MNYFETVERWHQLKTAIALMQMEERTLREGLFQGTFPNPREGVNEFTLPDGTVLKGTHVINRKIVKEKYLTDWSGLKLPAAVQQKLVIVKYDLAVGEYKKLTDAHRQKVDTILDIKPGLPKLELVPPKADES